MDQLQLAADFVHRHLTIFPFLWLPHVILMTFSLRMTFGGTNQFAKKHPLMTFVLGIFYCLPGAIFAPLMMGKPPFEFLLNSPLVLTSSVACYLTFFSPKDLYFSVVKRPIVLLSLACFQDLMRLKLAVSGVQEIHSQFPTALLYAFGINLTLCHHFPQKLNYFLKT